MLAYLEIILFGILQGITEFLPVSSSGHLTLFQYLSKNLQENLSLNIAVHLGTLGTILIYYRKDLSRWAFGFFRKESEAIKVVSLIGVASVPTAAIGLLVKKKWAWILLEPWVATLCFLVTAGFLWVSDQIKVSKQNPGLDSIDYKTSDEGTPRPCSCPRACWL